MKKIHRRKRSEASIQEAIRAILEADGFLVEKTHGNQFQPGFPDLYCFRRLTIRMAGSSSTTQHCWVEIKKPGGRLTSAQVDRFTKWEGFGLSVWVLSDESQVDLIAGPPNWRSWLRKNQMGISLSKCIDNIPLRTLVGEAKGSRRKRGVFVGPGSSPGVDPKKRGGSAKRTRDSHRG